MQLATLAEAKTIMGKNFHGPDETNLFFNCDLALDGNWLVPWTTETLYRHRKECVFVVGCNIDRDNCPITINKMKRRRPGFFQEDFTPQYVADPFREITTPVRARPYLIHKRIPDIRDISDRAVLQLHPSRIPMKVGEKMRLLKPYEQIETAVVHCFATILHYLTTHQIMYPHDYVLCANRTKDGRQVRIGFFSGKRIYVGCALPSITQYLGLAPGIKPDINIAPPQT